MVSTEQIRFDKKERVKTEEGHLSQARVLLYPERTLSVVWNQTHPRVRLESERE